MSRDGGSITISGYHEDDTILLCTVIMKENCNYLAGSQDSARQWTAW